MQRHHERDASLCLHGQEGRIDPVVGVDHIRSDVGDEMPQGKHQFRIRERRSMRTFVVGVQSGEAMQRARQTTHAHRAVHLVIRRARVPRGADDYFVSARRQRGAQIADVPLLASDHRRVEL